MRQTHCINNIEIEKIATECSPSTICYLLTLLIICFSNIPNAFGVTAFNGTLSSVSFTDTYGGNNPPSAKFTFTQEGNTFSFDASNSSDSDGNIVKYDWDFGDGTKASGVSVSHQYADTTISASISLTLLDNNNGVSILQQQIHIDNCQSQTADVSYFSLAKFTPTIYSDTVHGQSFTPTRNGEIYSIKVTTYYIPDPSLANLTIRIGNTPDLSTTYDIEQTVNLASYTSGDTIEIIFTPKPTMTAGVTKYFMLYNAGGSSTTGVKLRKNSNSGYAGGTEYTSTTGLANVLAGAGDMSFEVMACD